MEWIKTHWKEILIGLLIIFSLNKCTVACNRANKLNDEQKNNIELIQKVDSLLKVNDILSVRLDDGQKSQNTYATIATSNQKALIDTIESLRIALSAKTKENNKLIQENKILKSRIAK